MKTEDFLPLIPQYLSDQLSPVERDAFENRLRTDAGLRAEFDALSQLWSGLDQLPQEQPSAALRARFHQSLNAQNRPAASALRWLRFESAGRIAAVLGVFVIGIIAGRVSDRPTDSSPEVLQLRAELRGMREMVALSLLDRQSATARLEGVSWGGRADRSDRNVSSALLAALNHDPNVNVRLSAVDALEKFASDASIRAALVDSIAVQESPLVQISLIDALVQIADRDSAPELRRIAADEQVNSNVRGRARWALKNFGLQ